MQQVRAESHPLRWAHRTSGPAPAAQPRHTYQSLQPLILGRTLLQSAPPFGIPLSQIREQMLAALIEDIGEHATSVRIELIDDGSFEMRIDGSLRSNQNHLSLTRPVLTNDNREMPLHGSPYEPPRRPPKPPLASGR